MSDDLTLEQRVAALLAAAPTWSIDDRRGLRTVAEFRAAEVTALVRAAAAQEIAAAYDAYKASGDDSFSYNEGYLDGLEAAERIARGDTK